MELLRGVEREGQKGQRKGGEGENTREINI